MLKKKVGQRIINQEEINHRDDYFAEEKVNIRRISIPWRAIKEIIEILFIDFP